MTPMPTTMRKDWHEHLRGDRGDHRSRPRAAWGGRPDPAHRPAPDAAPARNGPRRRWGWGADEPDRRAHPHPAGALVRRLRGEDRKSTRLNSSHVAISYAVLCLIEEK